MPKRSWFFLNFRSSPKPYSKQHWEGFKHIINIATDQSHVKLPWYDRKGKWKANISWLLSWDMTFRSLDVSQSVPMAGNYVVTAQRPTAIKTSCVGNFTSPEHINLIISWDFLLFTCGHLTIRPFESLFDIATLRHSCLEAILITSNGAQSSCMPVLWKNCSLGCWEDLSVLI